MHCTSNVFYTGDLGHDAKMENNDSRLGENEKTALGQGNQDVGADFKGGQNGGAVLKSDASAQSQLPGQGTGENGGPKKHAKDTKSQNPLWTDPKLKSTRQSELAGRPSGTSRSSQGEHEKTGEFWNAFSITS